MEERVSGFRISGSWEDVVAHGERITRALRESDVDEDALAEREDWWPKAHGDLGEAVSEKTSLERGADERAGQAATEDFERTSEHALESIEKAEGDGPEDMLEKWEDALEQGLRAVDTTTRKAIRTLETAVYERVTTRFVPYYFDNELVSANLRGTTRLEDGDEFAFEVNVHDDQIKEKVSQRLDTAEEADREDV